jgi:hypothetical protein
MISRQLQLRLENQPGMKPQSQHRRRTSRAHWWFDKMRGVVDDARDWPTAAPSSKPAPPKANTPSPVTQAHAASVPPAYRWKFRRARQARWE